MCVRIHMSHDAFRFAFFSLFYSVYLFMCVPHKFLLCRNRKTGYWNNRTMWYVTIANFFAKKNRQIKELDNKRKNKLFSTFKQTLENSFQKFWHDTDVGIRVFEVSIANSVGVPVDNGYRHELQTFDISTISVSCIIRFRFSLCLIRFFFRFVFACVFYIYICIVVSALNTCHMTWVSL